MKKSISSNVYITGVIKRSLMETKVMHWGVKLNLPEVIELNMT